MERLNNFLKREVIEPKLISGFKDLDTLIDSFDKSNLYVLAGRPGMGKTAFGLTLVNQIAISQNANVVIISYEMNNYQIASRLLAISSGVSNNKILNQNLDESEKIIVNQKIEELENSNIFIECPSSLDFNNLRDLIRNVNANKKIDFLLIDDIHRITISEEDRKYASNREQEVSKNIRDLKALAKELRYPNFGNIPIK